MEYACLYDLSANAELCPLLIPTYLPPGAYEDHLNDFFTSFVERDLPELTNVTHGQIVMLLDDPQFQSGTFADKHNAVVDLFVQGLMEKRAEMFGQ